MKTHVFRLHPGQDLRITLEELILKNNIYSGTILTAVGSLKKATLRMADETITKTFNDKFEIVSLVGTIADHRVHLHISLSDINGSVTGGHLLNNCIINTTCEIAIGELTDQVLRREHDTETGFDELAIYPAYAK